MLLTAVKGSLQILQVTFLIGNNFQILIFFQQSISYPQL